MDKQHDTNAQKAMIKRPASGPRTVMETPPESAARIVPSLQCSQLAPHTVSPADMLALQQAVGNAAVNRLVQRLQSRQGAPALPARDALASRSHSAPAKNGAAAQRKSMRQGETSPIQRWREMAPLYKSGWKFSGGNIATNSNMDPLWHATVFRVDKTGTPDNDGRFFNGFHLTMAYGPSSARIEPHVFFDASGTYDAGATLGHKQTKAYIADVGQTQWEFDLQTARDLSTTVVAKLGPVLTEEQRGKIEQDWKAERDRVKEQGEIAAAEEAAKEAERVLKAAAAQDEETSIRELLKDVKYTGGPYYDQFVKYIGGAKDAIKAAGLKKVADWYVMMRDEKKWVVSEDPKNAYTNWGKTPIKVTWPEYQNCLTKTWRAKNPQTAFMSEFRMLKFNGYASYKLHPKAIQPPKV